MWRTLYRFIFPQCHEQARTKSFFPPSLPCQMLNVLKFKFLSLSHNLSRGFFCCVIQITRTNNIFGMKKNRSIFRRTQKGKNLEKIGSLACSPSSAFRFFFFASKQVVIFHSKYVFNFLKIVGIPKAGVGESEKGICSATANFPQTFPFKIRKFF